MSSHPTCPGSLCAIFRRSISFLCLGFSLAAFGQTNPAPAPDPTRDTDRNNSARSAASSDRRFFEQATEAALKAIAVSEAVIPKLANPDVRAFAGMVMKDHIRMARDLRALASRKGVSLPMADSRQHASGWTSKSENVDTDYLDEMINDHDDAVDLFEGAVESKDGDVASIVREFLPMLREHLARAKNLKESRG